MKHIIKTFLLVIALMQTLYGAAQLSPNFANLKAVNTNWALTAKQSFYNLQKTITSKSVVARKNLSNGFQELLVGINEDLKQTIKSSSETALDNGKIICKDVNKEIDLSLRPDFNILKLSSVSQIFPGVISTGTAIMGESVTTPGNLPARKPLNLNIFLPGAPVASAVLTQPGIVDQAVLNNLIVQNTNTPIPAMIGLSLTEVDSKFDFAANLETSQGVFFPLQEFGIPAEVNAGSAFSGNIDGSTKRKTYLLKFIQPMQNLKMICFSWIWE